MEIDYSKLASAYLQVLDESQIVIPEEIPANERNAFMGAAAAAHKAGKSHFNFGGQKHKVTMKKDTAKSINSEKIPEGVEKVECPKCEGKGCAHCDMKGYHMTGTADNNVKGTDEKKTTEKVQEGHMDGMCCKNCGDMFGQPTEGNCTYDAYDPKGKNWIKAEKQHESVEEDTNFVPHSNCPCGDDCNCDPCTCAEVNEDAQLDEKKTDIYHKHMLKALGKSRLPKNHSYTSAIANNGDFVVKDGGGRTVGRIAKGDHNLKEAQLDEISRSMTPMRNRFGGNVDPKKFDTYKKHMKTHKLDEPTVRMIHQNPDDAESKRMMKNPKYAQAVGLYKASMKEEVELDEVAQRPLHKGATVKGKFGGKVTSGKVVDHEIVQNKAGVVVHWKSGEKGRFPNDHFDTKGHHKSMNEKVEKINEVSDDLAKKLFKARDRNLGNAQKRRDTAHQNLAKVNIIKKKGGYASADDHNSALDRANARLNKAKDDVKHATKKWDSTARALSKRKQRQEQVEIDEKKLTPKEIKRALASIKPPKKKPTLPKAPFEIPKENTLPAPEGGKKSVRSADKKPVNVNVDGKTVTRMEPVTKRTAAAYESVNRENWLDALQNKKLQEAEDAKTKISKPTGLHHSDDATRDTFDKQLSTRKGEKDFVDAHKIETPEYADVLSVVPKTFAAFTAGVNSPKMRDNDNPQGDKKPVKNDGK